MMASRTSRANPRSDDRINNFKFDINKDGIVERNLGPGQDSVEIKHNDATTQIRLSFTSIDVGNGNAFDGNNNTNEDGGLAVRVQAEGSSDNPIGFVSRFDDEGITFTTKGDATFDVRDLGGTARGDQFDVVILGTVGADTFDESGEPEAYYINAGMGNDNIIGGLAADFLVGGAGNDSLSGNEGDDSFIGGGGNDTISGGAGDDRAIFNITADGVDSVNLGAGDDDVSIVAPAGGNIRVTFTSAEVGNGNALDAGVLANQDGGLAVRLELENADGTLSGVAVSRFDDEGISFSTVGDAKFDVRDLTNGAQRGEAFDVVTLGTNGDDLFDESGEADAYYINAGMGNDSLIGGLAADFLVGGAGNDRIDGREGDDTFIGGGGSDVFVFTDMPGNDRINDFVSGSDKLDFTAYGISSANVSTNTVGSDTTVFVDLDLDGSAEFQILLANALAPAMDDYLF